MGAVLSNHRAAIRTAAFLGLGFGLGVLLETVGLMPTTWNTRAAVRARGRLALGVIRVLVVPLTAALRAAATAQEPEEREVVLRLVRLQRFGKIWLVTKSWRRMSDAN
ncbi:hypothetical protein BU16DRAFT_557428 [Lophium mytilinum]|uniref:Uncharacterized protein n=1 Tax=Lophium mytilinum TaxID=390894 RepID=A0A6A6R2Y5_9PEZI|nr:hypothetical protein BU16DRAFT_557428 [Lophium mytilinum]